MAVEARPATHTHFFASALDKVFILEVTPWDPLPQRAWIMLN
jgi:hypothetical protein